MALTSHSDSSYLAILDAKELCGGAAARFETPEQNLEGKGWASCLALLQAKESRGSAAEGFEQQGSRSKGGATAEIELKFSNTVRSEFVAVS